VALATNRSVRDVCNEHAIDAAACIDTISGGAGNGQRSSEAPWPTRPTPADNCDHRRDLGLHQWRGQAHARPRRRALSYAPLAAATPNYAHGRDRRGWGHGFFPAGCQPFVAAQVGSDVYIFVDSNASGTLTRLTK